MKATFHNEKLLTVEGTPQEIAEFKDILAMGPKVPVKKVPYKAVGPYVGVPFNPPYTIGSPYYGNGSCTSSLTKAARSAYDYE